MFNKSLFFIVLMTNLIFSNSVLAKAKTCLVKPSYDIVVAKTYVQVVNQQNDLNITTNGVVTLNGNVLTTKPLVTKEAKTFQAYLRKELPLYDNLANKQLDEVNTNFEKAIREKLSGKSELLKSLASLHTQLVALLQKSIVTKDGITYFYHQPFNNLKKDGEEIGEKVFYKILGNSLLNFNVFKNYSVLKKIAKDEWKVQKVALQSFDGYVCELMGNIDNQYNHLMIGLQ